MSELVEDLLDRCLQGDGLAFRCEERGARSAEAAAEPTDHHLRELVEKSLQTCDGLDLLDEAFGDQPVVDIEGVECVLPFCKRGRQRSCLGFGLYPSLVQLPDLRACLRKQRPVCLVGAVELGADLVEKIAVDVVRVRRRAGDLLECLLDPGGNIAARLQVGGVEGVVAQFGRQVLLDLVMRLVAGVRPEEMQLTRDVLTRSDPVAKKALVRNEDPRKATATTLRVKQVTQPEET